jgi:hypothetical protein
MRRFRILVGLSLTAAGAVWLVSRLGGIDQAQSELRGWWPLVPIALGVLNLLALVRRPTWLLAPLLLIAGGTIGLLANSDRALPPGTRPYVWPGIVILSGIAIALWERERIEDDREFIRQTAVLRSRRIAGTTEDFQHGVVRVYLGNLELDLQRCQLPADAELCVTTVLGHVDLFPPPGIQVLLRERRYGPGVEVPVLPPYVPTAQPESDGMRPNVLRVSVMGFMGGFNLRPARDPQTAAVAQAPLIGGDNDDAPPQQEITELIGNPRH